MPAINSIMNSFGSKLFFTIFVNIVLLKIVICCNGFGDFCDAGDDDFEEFGEIHSLTMILDGRTRFRDKRSVAPVFDKKGLGKKVTETLDTLFAETAYDMRFRPSFGGDPTEIKVNIFIRSMGPIDESLQKFTFDCYFRQSWTDLRLAFNNSNTDLQVKSSQYIINFTK